MIGTLVEVFVGTPVWMIALGVYLARRGTCWLRHDAARVAKAALVLPYVGGGVLVALFLHDGNPAQSMVSWLVGLAIGEAVGGASRAAMPARVRWARIRLGAVVRGEARRVLARASRRSAA